MIKPDAYTKMGKVIEAIEKNGFVISNLKMVKLSLRDAQEFYAEHQVIRLGVKIFINLLGETILR